MPTNDDAIIEKIKSTYKNIAATIGSIAVFVLIMCAFTLGSLADSEHASFIWIQVTIAIVMILTLIAMKRIAFFLTRLWLGNRKRYKDAMSSLRVADMGRD
ncbi:MAG TPA: hypothetical protein VJ961_01020 [Mariprofundaceae bacterium]|nr:hypothetical protein [Mariprofundaceae bacterium]